MTLDWDWSGPNTMGDIFTVSPGVGVTLQEVQEVLRHHYEPVKLSGIHTSYCMMFPVVFSSEMTLDQDWSGPNTMRDLPTVSLGVGGTVQV